MINFYISFGQSHTHNYEGTTLDKDVLFRIQAHNYLDALKHARSLFGDKFASIYHEDEKDKILNHFSRGIHYA